MYLITLLIEDISHGLEENIISNVGAISDLKEITPENLRIVTDRLCGLACDGQFMRKGTK